MCLRAAPRFVFLILLAGCATDSSRPVVAPVVKESPSIGQVTFEQMWDRAGIDSAEQQGKDWERANNHALEKILEEADQACSQSPSLANGDEVDSAFVLEIDPAGHVRKIHVSPTFDDSECRRNVLTRAVFSPPPWDGYHLGVLLAGQMHFPDSPRTRLPETATFEEASMRALMDMNTDEGMQWMMSGDEGLTTAIRSLMTQCPTLLASADGNVLLTFEIASDGAVRRVLTADSAHLDCARSDLQRQQLAAPPWDGFWFPISIRKM